MRTASKRVSELVTVFALVLAALGAGSTAAQAAEITSEAVVAMDQPLPADLVTTIAPPAFFTLTGTATLPTTFTSISSICVEWVFVDDLLDPGEQTFIHFPDRVTAGGFGFSTPDGADAPRERGTSCSVDPVMAEELLDGTSDFEVEIDADCQACFPASARLSTLRIWVTATPSSAGVPDQSQPSFGAPSFPSAGNCGAVSLGQSFTSGITGSLDRVDLGVWRFETNTSAPLDVQIQTMSGGLPSGTVLATGSVPASSIAAFPQEVFVPVSFDPPAPVTEGVEYAIVLLPTNLECFAGYFWTHLAGDLYPRGKALVKVGGDPWQETSLVPTDFTFMTYVARTTSPVIDDLDIARAGLLTPRTGEVSLRGSATCLSSTDAIRLDVTLEQRVGRHTVSGGSSVTVPCSDLRTWATKIVSANRYRFVAGKAHVTVSAFSAAGDLIGQAEATVWLRCRSPHSRALSRFLALSAPGQTGPKQTT